MKRIKRLPKGFPITYITNSDKESIIRSWADFNKLTYAYSGTKEEFTAYISGFVVGDTKKKGISVVAEDNTDLCLCKRDPEKYTEEEINDFRELLRRGCYTFGEIHNNSDNMNQAIPPECQYK